MDSTEIIKKAIESIYVMEILTHDRQGNRYITRIRRKDGEIIEDTRPFDAEDEL